MYNEKQFKVKLTDELGFTEESQKVINKFIANSEHLHM